MTNNLQLLVPRTGHLKPVRSLEAAARVGKCIAEYRTIYVETPVHADFAFELETLRQLGIHTGADQHSVLQCGAPSSSGKSTVAKKFTQGVNAAAAKGKIPIVYMEIQSIRTSKDILKALLRKLREPLGRGETIGELHLRLSRVSKEKGVQMIILDEVHHLATYCQNESITAIKAIVNDGICPVALIGEDKSSKAFFEASSELLSRTFLNGELRPFCNDEEGHLMMGQFLTQINEELLTRGILQKPSDFLNDQALCNLFAVAGGVPGRVSRIIAAALSVAIRRNAEKIEWIDLAAGVDLWAMKACKLKVNPFYKGRSHA